jgi:carboxypeptidase family protein/TonB-dependent receptor-like protein
MRLQLVAVSARFAGAIALVVSARAARGQAADARKPAASPAHLRGQVVDKTSHGAVTGALIILDADGRFVTSDSTGAYDFENIPNGVVELTVRAERFSVAHFALRLIGTGSWNKDIELDSTAAAARGVARLTPVTVTAEAPVFNYRLQDFERRRASGLGQYLTDEEIQSSGASNIQDAVRLMRGVDLDCGGTAFAGCRIRMTRAPRGCSPEYIIDGQVDNVFGPTTPIRDVIAIEVYTGPSDVPGEYAGRNAGCGMVVLWTRSGPDRKKKPNEL